MKNRIHGVMAPERYRQLLARAARRGPRRPTVPLQAELVFAVLQAMDRWSLRHMDDLDKAEIADLAQSQLKLLKRLLAPKATVRIGHCACGVDSDAGENAGNTSKRGSAGRS